jgi:hypothetical protein
MRHAINTDHDSFEKRCPKLGHEILFSYCRQPGSDVPCAKIFDSPEKIRTITAEPPPKVLSLIELIQQAQERAKKNQ